MIDFLHYLLSNYKLILPNTSQILGAIGLIIFILTSSIFGSLFSKRKDFFFNFFVGYSINYIFSLSFFFLKINVNFVFFFILIICSFIILKDFNFYTNKAFESVKKNKAEIILISPLVIILISSNAIGWDTFTHWLPLANGIKSYSDFPTIGHAVYYPFASSLVLSNSSFLIKDIAENVSALFSIFLLITFYQILKKFNENFFKSKNNKIFSYFLILYVFYNPIHMNKFVYTAYADFFTSIIFVIIFYEMYIYFNKENKKNLINIALIASLLVGIKNTGIILMFIIFLSFFIFLIYKNKINFKNLFSLVVILSLPLFAYLFWEIILGSNQKGSSGEFFRFPLFKEENIIFFKSAFDQILTRPSFFIASLIIILGFIFFKTFNNKISNPIINLSFLYFFIFLFWLIFVISTYIFHFDINVFYANSFWRYSSQISLLTSFIFLFYLLNLFKSLNLQRLKIIGNLFIILILLNPIIFSYKLRRDLDPISLEIKSFQKLHNQFKKVLIVTKNNTYDSVKLNYYLQKPYSENIVESININLITLSEFTDKIKQNEHELYIYLKRDNNGNITKKIKY